MNKEIDIEKTSAMRKAGLSYFLAGSIIFMGIITGEMLYPDQPVYTTRHSQISDLGATQPPDSVITQPSADIFNSTMLISGLILLFGAYFFYKASGSKRMSAIFGILGAGALGVGIFPGNIVPWHAVFALTTFIFGGISAIISVRIVSSPLRYAYIFFGLISLVFLFGAQFFIPILGIGGTERYVAYPVVLWSISFGSYLVGKSGNLQ